MIEMRAWIWGLMLGVVAAVAPWSRAQPDAHRESIRGMLARWDAPGVPGIAVSVVRGGEVSPVVSVGLAHLEHGVPIDGGTVFHTASVSKQVTAAAVLLLEREGRLSLEDDVRRHLPEVPDLGETVRLRHLLWHTSGLRDQWQLLGAAGWREDDVVTNDHVWRAVTRQRGLNFPPGTRELYCNTGYTLLAEVVSRVSGEPFGAFCEREIFGPLGMGSTRFHDDVHAIVPRRAESYARAGDGSWRRFGLSFGTVGATGLLTTAEDLARWADELLTGRTLGRGLADRMREPGRLDSGEAISYASGLFLGEIDGMRTFGHPGADSGFRAAVRCVPDLGLGVVVLANRPDVDVWAVSRRIAALYDDRDARPAQPDDPPEAPRASEQGSPAGPAMRSTPASETGSLPPLRAADVAGRYRSAELETVYELRAQGESVVAVHFRNEPVVLRPMRDGVYGLGRWYFREIEIVQSPDGGVEGFLLHNSRARNIWFERE